MTSGDAQQPDLTTDNEPVSTDSSASSIAVTEASQPKTGVRGKPETTWWAFGIRVARIQAGRCALSVRRWARERRSSKAAAEPGRLAALKRATDTAVRSVKQHPKLAAAVACLSVAALAVTWKGRHTAPDAPVAAEKRGLVLDDVRVFQPPNGGDLPSSDSPGGRASAREPGRIPPGGARFTAGPAFPTIGESTQDAAAPMPATPRAVWLLGTVEDVEQNETRIQAAGNVELPVTERQRGLLAAPRVLRQRR